MSKKNNIVLTVVVLAIVGLIAFVLLTQSGEEDEAAVEESETPVQIAPSDPASTETEASLTIQEDEAEEASLEIAEPEPVLPAADTADE